MGLSDEIGGCTGEVREIAEWNWHAPRAGNGEGINGEVLKGDVEGCAKAELEGLRNGVSPGALAHVVDAEGGIKREEISPFVTMTSRFKGAFRSFAQGKVERVLEEDMLRHAGDPVVRGMRVVDARMDEEGDKDFPVVAKMEVVETGEVRSVRCKYLIGADGAHSVVRRTLGIGMEGDTLDDIWGFVDFVPDTDFLILGGWCRWCIRRSFCCIFLER